LDPLITLWNTPGAISAGGLRQGLVDGPGVATAELDPATPVISITSPLTMAVETGSVQRRRSPTRWARARFGPRAQ
jgi:hypothetical protein